MNELVVLLHPQSGLFIIKHEQHAAGSLCSFCENLERLNST